MENQHTTYSSQLDLAALLQQLTHSDQGVRRRAALTLGQLKARRAVGTLIATLQDYATVWDAATNGRCQRWSGHRLTTKNRFLTGKVRGVKV